ncbi:MAG: transposase [Roseovarius sp.]|nr:transposase [Roseovarius sp.]
MAAWRDRPLGEIKYLILDARYEKMRHGGIVRDVAVLSAIGIGPDERRRVLGVSVALSEAEVHWRAFLESLVARGLARRRVHRHPTTTAACAPPAALFSVVPHGSAASSTSLRTPSITPPTPRSASASASS